MPRSRPTRGGAKRKRSVNALRKANNAEKMAAKAAKALMAAPLLSTADKEAYLNSAKRSRMMKTIAKVGFFEIECGEGESDDE